MIQTKILFGPAGCGKTYAGRQFAAETKAALVFYQCHSWTTADDLFMGIHVPSAVAGRPESVEQPGALLKAAQLSHEGRVVLVIDELDKAPESAEALLLNFLQNGEVPIAPGEQFAANIQNLTVFITSNEVRPHTDPLLRRCKRVFMSPMSDSLICDIIESTCAANRFVVEKCWDLARRLSISEGNPALSAAEGIELMRELLNAQTKLDVLDAFRGWACRTREGAESLTEGHPRFASVWGIIKNNNAL